jgi:hypothetical protein
MYDDFSPPPHMGYFAIAGFLVATVHIFGWK